MCSTKFQVICVKFTAFIAVFPTWAKKPPCLPNVHLINVRKLFRLPIPAYKACHFSSSVDLCLHIYILSINSENFFFCDNIPVYIYDSSFGSKVIKNSLHEGFMLLDYRQKGNKNIHSGKKIFKCILLLLLLQNFDMHFCCKITFVIYAEILLKSFQCCYE